MPIANIDELHIRQAMERAWLLMAIISEALSDHPVVKSSKSLRRKTDCARKALFDIHRELEYELAPATRQGGANSKKDHRAKRLRRKGTSGWPRVRLARRR